MLCRYNTIGNLKLEKPEHTCVASLPPPVVSRRERAKKSIELDVCLSVWELVLTGPEFPLLKDFSEFLQGAKVPVVTKDMWAQVWYVPIQDNKIRGHCTGKGLFSTIHRRRV